jgi:uncharacterized membrane protein YidH (DUF202 family)
VRKSAHAQRRRKGGWLRTTIALVLAAVAVAIAAFVGAEVSTGHGYASWQDKASSLVRSVGMGPALD